ncbi:MAG TPA: chemotaxis protein CheW [Candidatus Binatia bacterium]|jgi:purine-binding chemotaxis protein CheW|nr:chemotaxis protein CheW [Candidatus Binatia bacterium]
MNRKIAAPQSMGPGNAETRLQHPPQTREGVRQEFSPPSAEEKKQLLKARAKELARDGEKENAVGESIEVVEFLLAYEKYGIESSYVREIHPLRELTPVPCTPPFVLGIINVRGQIISVIDMKKFFDLPERGLTDLNKVIIVHDEKMEFGILADSILGVRKISREEIQPPLPTLTGVGAEYLTGVTKEPLVVLDVATMLSSSNLVVHEEIER